MKVKISSKTLDTAAAWLDWSGHNDEEVPAIAAASKFMVKGIDTTEYHTRIDRYDHRPTSRVASTVDCDFIELDVPLAARVNMYVELYNNLGFTEFYARLFMRLRVAGLSVDDALCAHASGLYESVYSPASGVYRNIRVLIEGGLGPYGGFKQYLSAVKETFSVDRSSIIKKPSLLDKVGGAGAYQYNLSTKSKIMSAIVLEEFGVYKVIPQIRVRSMVGIDYSFECSSAEECCDKLDKFFFKMSPGLMYGDWTLNNNQLYHGL